jgi:hypothetical protein
VTPRDLRYLLLQCCLGSAIVNAVINGGLGWATTRSLPSLLLWRVPGVAADIVGTAFGVTFGTCLGMAFQIRRDLKSGKIGPVRVGPGVAVLLARFPYGTLRRSVGLGVLSVPLFACRWSWRWSCWASAPSSERPSSSSRPASPPSRPPS